MNRITPQDIQKGVKTVSASPESTWYKVVETLDNGDKLCLAIGMGEGFDEDTVCAKLGILAGNSAMTDYVWDFQMPWNLGEGGNDVWDTEVSNPGESDAEWFNTQAEEMIRGFEDGTIGTSLVNSRKNRRSVKSSRKPIKSEMTDRQYQNAIDKAARMIVEGERDISKICRATKLDESDVQAIIDEQDELENEITNSRKPIQSMARGYLKPEYDSRASFYNKAETDDNKLYSYGTLVADIVDGQPVLYPDWNYSATTIRHVREWLLQHGFDAGSKADIAAKYKVIQNSRKPIQSMYVTEDISGNDLYTRLWSGGKDQFNSMIEDGADADDILNACEELLFREEGNPPTLTEVNDLIWFEPDTIREYIGLTSPIESGCHGKSKKGKGKKKAVKSAMQISEIHNNTSNLYARIVYCDLESDVSEFNEEELIPINDFKEQCKGYAESTNGWFTVSHDNSYEPGEYIVTFTNQEGENNEFESDPYFENELGYVKFELICDAGEELCNYLEDD